MKYNEAIETMCKRCTNYDVCQGTGCEPKKTLAEFPNKVKNILEDNAEKYLCKAAYYKAKDNDLHDPFEAMRCEDFAINMKTAVRIVNETMGIK